MPNVRQEQLDRIIGELDGMDLKDAPQVLRWLCRHEEVYFTDTRNPPGLLERFTAAGWAVNGGGSASDETAEQWKMRVGTAGMARFVIGQALEGIQMVGSSHQLIHRFAGELLQDYADDVLRAAPAELLDRLDLLMEG